MAREIFDGPPREKATSFGALWRAPIDDHDVEVMVFEEPGKFHSHPCFERAMCLQGEGMIEFIDRSGDEHRQSVSAGLLMEFPPEMEHRMVPSEDNEEPFRWLLFYGDEALRFADLGIPYRLL